MIIVIRELIAKFAMKKGIVLPFLLLLASATLILGAFFLLGNKPKTPSQNATKTQSPSPAAENIYTDEGSANWKTYTNQEHGFEFRYPKDWIEQEPRNALVEIKDIGNRLILTINSFDPRMVGVTYCGAYPQDSKRCEQSVVAGKNVTIDWMGDFSGESAVILEEGLSMVLKTNPDVPARLFLTADDKALFRKILSTFKFTD